MGDGTFAEVPLTSGAGLQIEKVSRGAIAEALRKEIRDPSVRAIADRWMIGSIDLFNDNHMLDDDPAQRPLQLKLYECLCVR